MRRILFTAAGVVTGTLFMIAMGILGVQVLGADQGVIYDLTNTIVAIGYPHVPLALYLVSGVLAAAVAVLAYAAFRRLSRPTALAALGGFTATVAVLVACGFVAQAGLRRPSPEPLLHLAPWWQGWLALGGTSSAVHVVLLVAIACLVVAARTPRAPSASAPADGDSAPESAPESESELEPESASASPSDSGSESASSPDDARDEGRSLEELYGPPAGTPRQR